MKKSEAQKKLQELRNAQEVDNLASNLSRARSVTVGTCFGGTTEIMMRGEGGKHLWCVMQPVEVTELIHQLAANIGCHIQVQPRKDFASWRDWKYSEEELLHYSGAQTVPGLGFAPHVNAIGPHQERGQVLPPPEQQPGLKIEVPVRSEENVVATKKSANQRSTKRSSKAS
jgi:hypothetical protein